MDASNWIAVLTGATGLIVAIATLLRSVRVSPKEKVDTLKVYEETVALANERSAKLQALLDKAEAQLDEQKAAFSAALKALQIEYDKLKAQNLALETELARAKEVGGKLQKELEQSQVDREDMCDWASRLVEQVKSLDADPVPFIKRSK